MANTKVRGIKIELGLDTAEVTEGLRKVNSEIGSTSSQLKDVDKLLKADPKNMELLTQKTKLLQEQIANCKTKLEELKNVQATMDENGIDKNSEQYRVIQREIIATEQYLKELEQTAGSSSATLAKISTVTGEIGDKLESAGKKMSVVSAGIVAFGTAAVSAFNEVDSGMDIVIRKTGATGEAADGLEKVYKGVAKNIVADFDDIGAAVGEINTRFGLTGDELQGMSEEFLKFASINEMDVNSAVQGVDLALKTFNVDQSEAKNVMGLLSSTAQKTGISMDTLLGLLQSSGATLKEMGLSIDESITLMGTFEAAGIDSSTMLQKMTKAATYFNSEGLDMRSGLQDLIERLQDSNTEADATAEAYEIFGSKAGLAFITAAKEGKINLSDLSQSLESYATVVDDTYEATLDGTDKMKLAWQNMKLGMAELGEVIGETLAPIMEKITTVIQSVVEWFTNLDGGTKEMIVTIGLIVAAIGPLLLIGGKVMKGISSITSALSAVGSVTSGPIGLVIAAVAAAAAGIAVLVNAFSDAHRDAIPYIDDLEAMEEAHNKFLKSMDSAKASYESSTQASEANASAAQYLVQRLNELVAAYDGTAAQAAVIESTVDQINELVPGMALSWDSVTNSLSKTNDEIYANIEAMRQQAQIAALQDLYTESLKASYEAAQRQQQAQSILNDLCSEYGITMDDLGYVLEEGANHTQRLLEVSDELNGTIIQNRPNAEALEMAFQSLQDAEDDVATASENVQWAEDTLGEVLATTAQTATQSAIDIEETYKEVFGTSLPAQLQEAVDAAKAAGVDIPDSITTGLITGSLTIEQAITEIMELLDQTETASQEGTETAEAYIDATSSAVTAGSDEVAAAAQTTTEELDTSNQAYEIGADVSGSYGDGIDSQASSVTATAGALADEIASEFATTPSEMNSAGSDSGSSLNEGFGSWLGTVSGTVDEMYEFFFNTLGTTLKSKMWEWGDSAGAAFNRGLKSEQTTIGSTINNIVQSMRQALQSLPSVMRSIGDQAGSGLYYGLSSWQYAISNLAYSIASSINSAARRALQIRSPSRVLREVGQYSGKGIALGMEDERKNVLRTAAAIVGGVVRTFSGADMAVGLNAMNAGINRSMQSDVASGNSATAAMNTLLGLMTQYMPYLAMGHTIQFEDGTWAGQLAPAINEMLGTMKMRADRG